MCQLLAMLAKQVALFVQSLDFVDLLALMPVVVHCALVFVPLSVQLIAVALVVVVPIEYRVVRVYLDYE